MKAQAAKKLIEAELVQYDVPKSSEAFALVMEQATEAAEIMTASELKKYVADYLETLPNNLFEAR